MVNEGSAVTWNIVAGSPVADMTATLSGFPTSVAPGQPVTGTLTCTNAGPDPATSATCGATGLPSGASVTCTPNPVPNPLAVGATVSCAVSYTAPATPVTLTGTAGASNDSTPANNTAKETVAVSQSDMSAELTGFPATVNLNDNVTGTLTCINAGPDAAVNATCGATGLPAGATVTCNPTSPQSSLPAGGTMTCAVFYVAADPVTSPVTLLASTGAANDSNGANNSASLTLPGPASDMSASLSGFPATVLENDPVTGTLTCTNAGPDDAYDVICNVNGLPPGSSPPVCTPTSPQASLAPGASISCSVSYTAPDPVTDPVTLVGATSATNDSNQSNNSATLTVPGPFSDMAVSLTGFPDTITAGQLVTGTVSCLNLGPTGATAPSCAVSGLPSGSDTSVVCTPDPIPDTLGVGGLISCSVTYRATSSLVTVMATANASNDLNAANNQASQVVTGTASDMSAQLSGFPTGPISPNTTVTGTLTCTNNGPDTAVNATCNVNGLPPGSNPPVCTPTPPANLPAGGTISCVVSYTAPTDPVTLVGATDAANDPDTTNNTGNLVVPGPQGDMAVSLTGFPATVITGQTVTGTVSCVNNGPNPAENALCAVTGLPEGASVACTPTSPQSTLAVGGVINCAVSYEAPNPATQPITVTGVTNASNDPNTNNNTAAEVVPGARADMAVAVSGFPTQVTPGVTVVKGTVSCVNGGPGTAADAFCNVSGLPAGASVSCTPNTQPANLPVGGIINCAVSYTAPTDPVTVIGTTGAVNDPNAVNNTAEQKVPATSSDMSAALSGFPTNPAPGQKVSGVLTCLNAGPDVATNATCNLSGMPPGATVTCTPTSPQSTLAVGSSLSCLVSYVQPATPVTLLGIAGADNDPNLINNTAEQKPGPVSDMSVSLSGFPSSGTLTPGQTYTGTVACKNTGPSAATNAFCDVNIPGATVTCTPTSPQATLAPGQTMNCAVSFVASASASTMTVLGITGASNDPNASNNTARQTIPGQIAHVGVTVSGFPPTTYAGQTVTGTVTCTSDGQVTATNAYCNISGLPPGATVSCTPSNTAAALPVGQSLVCRVSYVAPASGTVNIVAITGAGNDANNVQHIGVAPTVVTGPRPPPNPIPTLSEWGQIIMMLMMLGLAWEGQRRVRRR